MKLRQAKKVLTRLHGPLGRLPVRWPMRMYSQYKQSAYAAAAIRWNRHINRNAAVTER